MEIEKLDTRTLNNGTSMPIGKNFFRAKLKDRKQWIEGFYCRINETTYCTTDSISVMFQSIRNRECMI